MPAGLEWVSAELDTVRGRVSSAWKREEDAVVFDIEIPVGAKAELLLPNGLITEGGEALTDRELRQIQLPRGINAAQPESAPPLTRTKHIRLPQVFARGSLFIKLSCVYFGIIP